jgi:hypothetical protein
MSYTSYSPWTTTLGLSLRTVIIENCFSYRKAKIVFDVTQRFCRRFLAKTDRTIDQMIQIARWEAEILEGSKASAVSKEKEIKLTGVARVSLEELLTDYRDSLRVRNLPIWEEESRKVRFVRDLGSDPDETCERYREFCETRSLDDHMSPVRCRRRSSGPCD